MRIFKPTLLVYLLLSLASCENSLDQLQNINGEIETAVETSRDVEVLYTEKGQVKAKLIAPTLLRYKTKEPYIEFPDGVEMKFFDDQMRVKSQLKADYGIKHEKSKEVVVRDNVVILNPRGEKLETNEVSYLETQKLIVSKKPVKITTARDVIYGDGMEAKEEEEFSVWRVTNPSGRSRYSEDQFR